MKQSTEQQIAKLKAELEKIHERRKQRSQKERADSERGFAIDRELHRLRLNALVGLEAGVMLRFRHPATDRCANLNDARGTLLDVRRTRATVDFGAHGRWNMKADSLIPSSESTLQGMLVVLGGASQ